ADDRYCLAWTDRRRVGGEPARAQDVGGCEDVRDQVVGREIGRRYESTVRERNAEVRRLCSFRTDGLGAHAAALVPRPADATGIVGCEERSDHELAWPYRADLAADLLDDADVLVTHGRRLGYRLDPAVGP